MQLPSSHWNCVRGQLPCNWFSFLIGHFGVFSSDPSRHFFYQPKIKKKTTNTKQSMAIQLAMNNNCSKIVLKYLNFSITFSISCNTSTICTSKTVARASCCYTVFRRFVWTISAVYDTWKWLFFLFDKFGPHRLMNIQMFTKLPSHWSYELIHCPSLHRHWYVVHCAIDIRFETRWPVNTTTKKISFKNWRHSLR